MILNKKIKIIDFKLSKILNWWLFWAYKSKFTWNWMEFAEHKEYQFWDGLKNIDWKASARSDQIFTKKYEEERDLNVLFVIDNFESMQFWSKEKTKKDLVEEIFYSIWLSAFYNNDSIWWVVFDENSIFEKFGWKFFDYKKSRENIYKILEELEKNKNNKKEFFWDKLKIFLEFLVKKWVKNNLIFILTDWIKDLDDTNLWKWSLNEKLLKKINGRNEVIFINIFDFFENFLLKNLDLWWEVNLSFWEEFLNIDFWDKKKILEYQKLREKKLEFIKNNFEKNHIWYIKIDTESDVSSELIRYFENIKR